jgi:hypothetical protein
VLLVFFKVILYFISLTNFKHILISDENFEKFRNILTNCLDFLLVLIALFIMFLRKNNSNFAVILAIIIIFKASVRSFIDFGFYKYTNLSDNTINYIKEYKSYSVFVTNVVLFLVTVYSIKKIFYN